MCNYIYYINVIAFSLHLISQHLSNRNLIYITTGLFTISAILIIFTLLKNNKILKPYGKFRLIITLLLNIAFIIGDIYGKMLVNN